MATTYTPNYNLGKQIEDKNDTFLMSVITDNADKIDAALMTKEDNLPDTPSEPTKKFLNGNKEWSEIEHNQLRDLNADSDYQHITQTEKDKLTATTKTIIAEITDTIEALYWSATAPFAQNITLSVPGHTITDADYDINIYRVSNSVVATDKLEIEAYSYIDKAVISADNTLTLTAYDYKPLTDINVKIEVVEKW